MDDWDANDPDALLVRLKDQLTEKQLRLWCCACLRRVWNHLSDSSRQSVIAAEGFANGSVDRADLDLARQNAESKISAEPSWNRRNAAQAAAWIASSNVDALGTARFSAWGAAYAVGCPDDPEGAKRLAEERIAQLELLRELVAEL